ncbi:ribosome biogenesis protein [Candidatus Woesearchaeota archaeon]|nr:MAG: ribosome biogenesis protein [Candidatus Woesearchaeota archaeon]
MKHLYKHPQTHEYTMKEEVGGKKTLSTFPPKYSPEDPMGEYRRRAKRELLQKEGKW